MATQATTTIRMFGALHTIRKERGLSSVVEMDIPANGCAARSLIDRLDLPIEKVEGVFINHRIYALDTLIYPGDQVAFVPIGIPGSRGLFGAPSCH